jgi:hypothetical protein
METPRRTRCPRPSGDTRQLSQAAHRDPHQQGRSGNPRGRPAKKLAALLAAALNEKVTVTENGKRRRATKREAVIAQPVNKSASAELRATKMLIHILRDVEKKAGERGCQAIADCLDPHCASFESITGFANSAGGTDIFRQPRRPRRRQGPRGDHR